MIYLISSLWRWVFKDDFRTTMEIRKCWCCVEPYYCFCFNYCTNIRLSIFMSSCFAIDSVIPFFFEQRHQKSHQHQDEGSITAFITKQTIVFAFIDLNTNSGGFFHQLNLLQKFLKTSDFINPHCFIQLHIKISLCCFWWLEETTRTRSKSCWVSTQIVPHQPLHCYEGSSLLASL